jgi:mannose-6-phosphate isomerase-like protein (cupin superfamily)
VEVADAPRGLVVPPGQGERIENVEVLARSEDTPRFNFAIITISAGAGGPEAHVHASEDDSFYVLDGELTFELDEGDVPAPAGTFVLVPPGVRHTFRNDGAEPARFVNVHAPAGFDERLRD